MKNIIISLFTLINLNCSAYISDYDYNISLKPIRNPEWIIQTKINRKIFNLVLESSNKNSVRNLINELERIGNSFDCIELNEIIVIDNFISANCTVKVK